MSTALLAKTINLPAPISSLDAYIQSVNSIPMLSVEKEQELAREL
ncbi:MAG: RNA polymerase sigma factor RpoH, partial [Candidatus Competibacteraceae bacterium]|nr:RNA polymerase sigma factor RpoH [Candidatus Competibacteraceae bacterium]